MKVRVESNTNDNDISVAKQRASLPGDEYWSKLREAYFAVKDPYEDEDDEDLREALEEDPNGALVPFEIRRNEYGRGIYATQFISEGTPVWNCEHAGVFRNEQQWLDFLKLLPPHMQHDCVEWAYVEDGDLWLDLEPCALMNHGGTAIEEEDMKNVRPDNLECIELPSSDDEWQYIAKCDIQPGEELLCDYSKFHDYSESLDWFEESWDQIVEEEIYY